MIFTGKLKRPLAAALTPGRPGPWVSTAFLAGVLSLGPPEGASGQASGAEPFSSGACRGAPTEGSTGGLLRWFGPDSAGDLATLDRWCGTVGQPVFRPDPAMGGEVFEASHVAVATWNTHGGGGDLLGFLERELGFACGHDGQRPEFRPFVLLLQEAVRSSSDLPAVEPSSLVPRRLAESVKDRPRLDIVQAAERCGLALLYVPSMRNGHEEVAGRREDRGNAILSSLPLADPVAIELPFEAQRRVAVGATVTIPGRDPVRVVSLHLDTASGILRTLITGNGTRLRQGLGAVESLTLMEHTAAPPALRGPELYGETSSDNVETLPSPEGTGPIATVLAGDLNTWSDQHTVIRHLLRHFPESPAPDGEPTRGRFPADHLFFRVGQDPAVAFEHGSYRRIDDPYHSDHQARVGTLIYP